MLRQPEVRHTCVVCVEFVQLHGAAMQAWGEAGFAAERPALGGRGIAGLPACTMLGWKVYKVGARK